VQVHEFPQRDVPYAEDLGRKNRELKISALVVGDDVFQRRDRLMRTPRRKGRARWSIRRSAR